MNMHLPIYIVLDKQIRFFEVCCSSSLASHETLPQSPPSCKCHQQNPPTIARCIRTSQAMWLCNSTPPLLQCKRIFWWNQPLLQCKSSILILSLKIKSYSHPLSLATLGKFFTSMWILYDKMFIMKYLTFC